MTKAKKIFTMYDKYFNTVTYEYRGHRYDVLYSKNWMCCTTPAYIQHRDEQRKIDEAIDNPKQNTSNPIDWDNVWQMIMGE